MRLPSSSYLVAFLLGALAASSGRAQQTVAMAPQGEGPKFFYASNSKAPPRALDVKTVPVLRRQITLQLDGGTLADALDAITQQTGLAFVYGADVIRPSARVSLRAERITVAAALTEILLDAGVDVLLTSPGQAALVKRPSLLVGTITGRVTEAKTGQPVPLAQVSIAGAPLARTTDENGRYMIAGIAAGAHAVTVRRLGYDPIARDVIVPDGGSVTVDFELAAATTRLAEIVTTVTGDQRRLELGNAIANIRADSTVVRAPVRDLGDLINGRAAGVQVIYSNGIVGQAPTIRVRGVNSITLSNDPIVIIDGVRAENSPGKAAFDSRVAILLPTSGRLGDLNPEEIETLDVVKGPSAATLYGTDAANGVIIVTTKKGRAGRTEWTAYTEQGASGSNATWPTNYYAWGHSPTTGAVQQCVLLSVAAGTCVRDSITTFNPLRDASNSPLGTGYREQYGLQVSGGFPALRYFLSGEREAETGFLRLTGREEQFLKSQIGNVSDWQVRPNALEKTSFRANLAAAFGTTADASVNAGFVRNNTRLPNTDILGSALTARGVADTLQQWGSVLRPAYAFLDKRAEGISRFTSGLSTNWRIRPWLTSRATLGVDYSNDGLSYLLRRSESPAVPLGRRLQQDQNITIYTGDVGASASFAVTPMVSARTSVGGQYTRRTVASSGAFASGLAPGSSTVTGAATISGFESLEQSAIAGGYAEETVGYREHLFVTAALRLDGGSSFGRKVRQAAYPKASVSWLALDGAGSAPLGVTSLRLRAAYGASGVQPSPIAALARDTLFSSLVNGTSTNGASLTAVANPNLKAERQREVESGFDLETSRAHVRLEITAYQRQSSDALIDLPFAASFGLGRTGSRQINIGEVRNRGLEGLLSLRLLDREVVSWDLGLNGNANQNRLLKLSPEIPRIGSSWFRQVPGYPIHSLWERPILSYADANGNGIIEPTEVVLGDTTVFFGPVVPTRQLSLTTGVGLLHERLRVSALFDYRGGHKLWPDGTGSIRCGSTPSCREVNDPTAPLDRQAAAVAVNRLGNVYAGYFQDGSYTKFRELSLSYSSDAVARRLRARTALLTLSGRNLATFTKYTGIDPEGSNAPGTDEFSAGAVPFPARYLIARVTLGY